MLTAVGVPAAPHEAPRGRLLTAGVEKTNGGRSHTGSHAVRTVTLRVATVAVSQRAPFGCSGAPHRAPPPQHCERRKARSHQREAARLRNSARNQLDLRLIHQRSDVVGT
jgi:hypothetical protein